MKRQHLIYLLFYVFTIPWLAAQDFTNVLWYKGPASDWMEALPVGNGRLGAMVYGNPQREHLQLNEDSMWPGGPEWGNSKGNKTDLELIRNLLREDKPHMADSLIVERFSYKSVTRSHQTMGDLYLDFLGERKITDYFRSLDMENAVVTVKYSYNGHQFTERIFSSAVDNVLLVELTTTDKEGMDLDVSMDRPKDEGHTTVSTSNPHPNEIGMQGMVTQFGGVVHSTPTPIDHGVKFETRLKAITSSGTVTPVRGTLQLRGVRSVVLQLSCSTSFYHYNFLAENDAVLGKIKDKSFAELYKDHQREYQSFFNRMSLDLEGHAMDSLPTDVRLERKKQNGQDPDLAAKLFQYGRYLLISSSRPGTNPANLQGIWNQNILAPWNSDYHLNINLQMNYWPAEVTNLSEMHLPLFDFSEKLLQRGRITAKEQYGIDRGAVLHHATDLWAPPFMRAARPYWGAWIHGGGWLAQHFWEHYRYTGDTIFLKERGYPYMKALSEFYLDWLILDERDNKWVSAPETSPENSYIASDGKPAAVSYGGAIGHQIIHEVFENVLASAQTLGIEDEFTKEVRDKLSNMRESVIIGPDGRILEWDRPYEEFEKGHRHMSHLYAFHPGDAITVGNNPEAFAAVKKTIDYRLQHGGAKTGWSRAWMINFNARLFDKEAAEENIDKFFELSMANNLFDMHPPFQIDGNFGYTAGVAELVMQSHEGFLRILPTLPNNWPKGSIKGLVARGNIIVDIAWENGKLITLNLKSKQDSTVKIVYEGKAVEVTLPKDQLIVLDGNLDVK